MSSFAQSARVLKLKHHLEQLGRAVITKQEYLDIAHEQVQMSDTEATELLRHFHESATFCHYANDPALNNEIILKPETILQQIYSAVQPSAIQDQITLLIHRIEELHSRITPLLQTKVSLDGKANSALNNRVWFGLAYLSAQTAFLAKLTWIDYGWDVVEPITYFVTFTTAILGYIYFTFRKRDYSYEHAMKSWLDRRRAVEYGKAGFSLDLLQELQLQYDRHVQQLLQLNLDSFGPVEGQIRFEQQMASVLKGGAARK